MDRAARPEEVGEGERKGTFARSEVGPDAPAAGDSLPKQPDMVVMVHGSEVS